MGACPRTEPLTHLSLSGSHWQVRDGQSRACVMTRSYRKGEFFFHICRQRESRGSANRLSKPMPLAYHRPELPWLPGPRSQAQYGTGERTMAPFCDIACPHPPICPAPHLVLLVDDLSVGVDNGQDVSFSSCASPSHPNPAAMHAMDASMTAVLLCHAIPPC